MRLSRKRNSIYMAAIELSDRVPDCRSSRKKSTTQMMGYEVYDVDGETMPDLIPRLSCATKREMSSNQESYTASFFGVSLCAPMAKGKSKISIDKRGDHDRDTRKISCYEELRFERPEDREFYQQKMYGTAFVPQKLRGRITLVVRNARFERKSTGIRFNQDRDREEFAASLSKRYTFKKSIPRCDIPRENWQKLMRNQAGTVYLHYYNREDAERASHIFRDDDGQPLVLRLELKADPAPNILHRDLILASEVFPSRPLFCPRMTARIALRRGDVNDHQLQVAILGTQNTTVAHRNLQRHGLGERIDTGRP
ncbi:hypothetical protein PHPALM_29064 [Phytophthora palmivora]|uniref:Uncharacterized protein n=1 Tax=Phytophthora palmivora TaxID=4796 RepID=A0A2P4X8J1_9STRA|nr:hypothetical protein PHPALM_29064 [Phytophthora palmivora]